MKELYFTGFNAFGQFKQCQSSRVFQPTTAFSTELLDNDFICTISWSFVGYAIGNKIVLQGFIGKQTKAFKCFDVDSEVKQICSNDNFCLALLENADVLKIDIRKATIEKLNFLSVEQSYKRNIFGNKKQDKSLDEVSFIACGRCISIAISKQGNVYNIPTKIHAFPMHIKIQSVVCGFEHALLLTTNGDMYSMGNGTRGQLGQTELRMEEVPKLIEALAGVKIIDIAASGWHSAAISTFGDLYTWGSNINGQLGLRVYSDIQLNENESFLRKNATVWPLPQLIDFPPCCNNVIGKDEFQQCNIIQVFCGARHTFVKLSCGKVFCTGWNEYGQLGIKTNTLFLDNFTEFNILPNVEKIICGSWSTIFCK